MKPVDPLNAILERIEKYNLMQEYLRYLVRWYLYVDINLLIESVWNRSRGK